VLTGDLMEQLRAEHLLEILGASGPFGFRYAISARGRERAARLLEISGYIGPDLVHVVAARRPTPDGLPDALDRVGVVDTFALVADSEHG
jgi:hypothetical protein